MLLAYDYASRLISLEDAEGKDVNPHLYLLCVSCAEKLRPPKGWKVEDRRAPPGLLQEAIKTAPADHI